MEEKNKKRLNIEIDEELRKELKHLVVTHGITLNKLVTRAILYYIKKVYPS